MIDVTITFTVMEDTNKAAFDLVAKTLDHNRLDPSEAKAMYGWRLVGTVESDES